MYQNPALYQEYILVISILHIQRLILLDDVEASKRIWTEQRNVSSYLGPLYSKEER